MKNLKNKLISMSLAILLGCTFSMVALLKKATYVNAAEEQFLSEVALVYENSYKDAQEAVAGTGWKVFNKDLNPNNDVTVFDDGVYLVYKTSTNVEDAITDLRVMDMYGGYSTSNYKQQLEESRKEYNDKIYDLRIAAAEFKERFEESDRVAMLAYRQMNYYQDIISENGTETGMLMGDYFLNLPNENEPSVQVLFEGNATIVANLVSLLAIGISNADGTSLSDRIAEKFAIKDTLTDEEYHEDAKSISQLFEPIKAKLIRYESLKDSFDYQDEEISDEEYTFITEYATIAEILTVIKYGNQTLAEFIKGDNATKDYYPLVAAFTPGQRALANMGLLETVLKYNSPSKAISEMTKAVDEVEKEIKAENNGEIPVYDVYSGVDREIFKGDFAMTTSALRQQALTGETWDAEDARKPSTGAIVGYIIGGVLDVAVVGALTTYGVTRLVLYISNVLARKAYVWGTVANAEAVYFTAKTKYQMFMLKWGGIGTPLIVAAIAITLILLGSFGIATWYNYYNPDYLEIPTTLIDVRETDLGDKYIKYSAAKVINGEEGQEVADFNAYEAKEWIALYYTKDANAGNCLTPNFVYRENDNRVTKRHQGVSMFGEDVAFNLNSHVYREDATGVYLSVRYSTTKKGATNMPSVIGSMLNSGGYYALAVMGGIGVGVAITLLLQYIKKKKKEETVVEETATEN